MAACANTGSSDWVQGYLSMWILKPIITTAGITNHPQPLSEQQEVSTHETSLQWASSYSAQIETDVWPPHVDAFTKGLAQSFVSRQLVGSSFELGQTRSHRLSRPSEGDRLRNLRSDNLWLIKILGVSWCFHIRADLIFYTDLYTMIYIQCRYWRSCQVVHDEAALPYPLQSERGFQQALWINACSILQ